MKRYDPSGKPSDVYNWYGMTVAWTMVETLKLAGRTPTRASLLRAAHYLNLAGNPFLLPGIAPDTPRTRYFPLHAASTSTAGQQAVGQVELAARRSRVACSGIRTHTDLGDLTT